MWSEQQHAIFDWFALKNGQYAHMMNDYTPPNLVVRARAGTGKTTTLLEGVNRAPESSILVCAFNKTIADELTSRLENPRAEARTLHSLGFRMITREWRRMPVAQGSLRADWLTDTVLKQIEDAQGEKVPYQIKRMISMLHTKGREMVPLGTTEADLLELAFRFDYVPDEGWGHYDVNFVVDAALAAMHYATDNPPRWDVGIDYADMIFLPLAHRLTSRDYQLVVVDEAQDMTLAQLEIAQRVCSGRICVVGDDKQAIYGFRGADSGALDRLKTELHAMELPLTVTYRCGHNIVEHAQTLVPDIQGHPSNGRGIVDMCVWSDMIREVRPGDFVLSRLNAPLVGLTFDLLRNGIRARMKGRDIGKSVEQVLKKAKVSLSVDLDEAVNRVRQWHLKTTARLAAYGQEDQIARVNDQCEVLYALAAEADDTPDLLRKCDYLFTDEEGDMVLCSSIHKAKGLEAERVFVLMDTLYRRGDSPEEQNIHYVAITRAKTHLHLVSSQHAE